MTELEGRELDAKVAELMGWHWDGDWNCLIPPEQFAKPDDMWTVPNLEGYQEPVKENIVSGITYNANFTSVLLPNYSTDIAAAWLVEDRIEELGLIGAYCKHLNEIATAYWDMGKRQGRSWQLIHATPEDRCRAAVMAVEAE